MDWLEFIAQMTSALAWPLVAFIAIVLLRTQIRTAADSLVARIGEITRLKAPGVDVEFEKEVEELAEKTEALRDEVQQPLPPAEGNVPAITNEPYTDRYQRYETLAIVDPRAAILVSFSDLEYSITSEFRRRYPESRHWRNFTRIIQQFSKDGLLDDEVYASLRELAHLRNQVAHTPMDVKPETAQYYIESIRNVSVWILLMPLFGQDDTDTDTDTDSGHGA